MTAARARRDRVPLPLVAAGAVGTLAVASLLRSRAARAAAPRSSSTAAPDERADAPRAATPPPASSATAPAPPAHVQPHAGPGAPLEIDLGRPVPDHVRAIVSSGWLAPRDRRIHRALDIPLPIGTPVLAVGGGIVVRAEHADRGDAGRWLAIQHPSGLVSRYLHLARVLARVGHTVRRGETIGLSGDTGNSRAPHLHLDLRVPGAMLPRIEAAIGRPHPGWGPELRPFGFSIPGEPFVPVDGYQDRVKRDAALAGIALRAPIALRNAGLVYRPVGSRGERYPDWLQRIKGSSGIYVIRERDPRGEPVIVYVGSSSAGRLYETLTRHLQTWRRWKGFWSGQYGEGHDPGLTYDRDRVEVAVRVTPAEHALDEEARLIRRLRPRDNLIGKPEDEDTPF